MVRIKDIILGISIAVIFAFFIGFGISAFYPAPEWNDFCGKINPNVLTDSCPTTQKTPEPIAERYPLESCWCNENTGECFKTNPEYLKCQEEFEDIKQGYDRNVFIIAAIIGLITMIIGGFVLKHESVSPGLMGGGFLTLIYGVMRYWQYAGDRLRFIILGITLAMLIYLAYRKFPFIGKKK